jgi:hypothetical protein
VRAASELTSVATLIAWLMLVSVGGLGVAAVEVPLALELACGVLAIPLAIAAAVRDVLSTWRGPRLIAFDRADAVRCDPVQAEQVRAAAQLRGTMGGAGHVHASRLAFPIASWLAALGAGTEVLLPGGSALAGAWSSAGALVAALLAWIFPARPYWYREVTGGGILVTPPEAAAAIAARDRARDWDAVPGRIAAEVDLGPECVQGRELEDRQPLA